MSPTKGRDHPGSIWVESTRERLCGTLGALDGARARPSQQCYRELRRSFHTAKSEGSSGSGPCEGIEAEHRVRTGDLRLGNSEGRDSRTSTSLNSDPKPSISLETATPSDPRISHTAPQKHESPGPTGVQEVLLSVGAAAVQLGVCKATVYTLSALGQLPHARILNTIRIAPRDLKAFVAARRMTHRPWLPGGR